MNADDPILAQRLRDHLPWVMRQAIALGQHTGQVDDLVQEGLLAICEAHETYRPGQCNFLSYASRAIRWRMLGWLRTSGQLVRVPKAEFSRRGPAEVVSLHEHVGGYSDDDVTSLEETLAADTLLPDEACARRDIIRSIQRALGELKPGQRVVIEAVIDGRPDHETCRGTGVGRAAINLRKQKALGLLKKNSATYEDTPRHSPVRDLVVHWTRAVCFNLRPHSR